MLGSSTSGIFSRFFTYPIDTCKAKLQVDAFHSESIRLYRGTIHAFQSTLEKEGIAGLYRGFAFTAIGSAPASMLYFTSYEITKDYLSASVFSNVTFVAHFCAGLIAEAFSCVLWVPIDVVKERMQVQTTLYQRVALPYSGSFDACAKIIKTEGLSGIYKGYGATIGSFGPFSALYFLFYEKCKSEIAHFVASTGELPLPYITLSGAISGALASFLTNPLDMAKLRMQIDRGSKHQSQEAKALYTFEYRNMVDGLTKIVRHEGYRGLWKGAGARMAFHAPNTAIMISAFEQFRRFYTTIGF